MTAKQIKDLIRNRADKDHLDAQILLRNYMLERFLERVANSVHQRHFVLKGGMLVAAMVGLDARSTVDMDATLRGYPLNADQLDGMLNEILSVPVDDDVQFEILDISEIREGSDYECFRVSMTARVERTLIPIKLDITTGDAITPRETRFRFKLLLENRNIDIMAYPLETVLAEKMETVLSKHVLNTRMRDFYDLHILYALQRQNIDFALLAQAIRATAKGRGTGDALRRADAALEQVLTDPEIIRLWENYRRKFGYAADLEWAVVAQSVRALFGQAIGL